MPEKNKKSSWYAFAHAVASFWNRCVTPVCWHSREELKQRKAPYILIANHQSWSDVFILACGMLMCMLTGGNIDLSCGSFVCFLGAIGGYFMVIRGLNAGVSILLMLLIGILYGVALGYLVAYVNIPPWIATLAGFLAFRGLGTQILATYSKTQ